MTKAERSRLAEVATRIRRGALTAVYHAGSGHPGGSLSAADLLAYLWTHELRGRRDDPERDRFILSKGHCCPALYAAAAEAGVIPRALLTTLRKLGSPLQGHPHVLDTPWAETSTGSLGQGFSVAIGMALGLRFQERSARVYVMLGDGELQEGEVWEGAMCAGHYRLGNLCAIVDYNKLQSDAANEHIMGREPLATKWAASRWQVLEIDGHEPTEIAAAFAEARAIPDRPTVILAHTTKGKGVSFMENEPAWHGSVKLRSDEFVRALSDLATPAIEMPRYLDGTL